MLLRFSPGLALVLALAPVAAFPVAAQAQVAPAERPAALVADGIPPVPRAIAEETKPYLEARHADFLGWDRADRSMLIKTRFASTNQLHVVAAPDGAREQVSFEDEPILMGSLAPSNDHMLIVQKDVGGDEFYQLYRLVDGRLHLLTDGHSRNWFGAWSHDGQLLGYSSTRRNGADADLYVIDPRDPTSDRLIATVSGGGWNIADFSDDKRTALVINRMSINHAALYRLDLSTGRMTAIGNPRTQIAYADPHYAPDGTIWVLSDENSDFVRLGTLDPATGRFTPRTQERWGVSDFAVAPDGSFVAYATNEAGVSVMHVMDTATGTVRKVEGLPPGVLPWAIDKAIQIAPWGAIGFSMSSAHVPGDAYSVDPRTLQVTQWTHSETGGLNPARNAEPEFVTVRSFDGVEVSGFLYRPDPARFPGRRPMLMDIHGGPEGQTRPGFLGPDNYFVNELGIAMFYPNVRGSSGFGKRFVNLDNGPDRREDSVRDVGAFLDALQADSGLDSSRFAVTGLSYGGYMCYATAIRYGARLRGANCYVGISNFVTFLENTQDYRRDLRRVEYGDERDPAQRAKLMAISPLSHVDEINLPMLIATGGNDPRVPASEGEQIVNAIRARGGTAWHLLARNEGHVFHKKENEDYYFWTRVLFFKQTLLGETQQ